MNSRLTHIHDGDCCNETQGLTCCLSLSPGPNCWPGQSPGEAVSWPPDQGPAGRPPAHIKHTVRWHSHSMRNACRTALTHFCGFEIRYLVKCLEDLLIVRADARLECEASHCPKSKHANSCEIIGCSSIKLLPNISSCLVGSRLQELHWHNVVTLDTLSSEASVAQGLSSHAHPAVARPMQHVRKSR